MFFLLTGIFAILICSAKSDESQRNVQQNYENLQRQIFERDQQNMALEFRIRKIEENVQIQFEQKDIQIQKLEKMIERKDIGIQKLEQMLEMQYQNLIQKDKQAMVLERRLRNFEERLHSLEISEPPTAMKESVKGNPNELDLPNGLPENATLHRGFENKKRGINAPQIVPNIWQFGRTANNKLRTVFLCIPVCKQINFLKFTNICIYERVSIFLFFFFHKIACHFHFKRHVSLCFNKLINYLKKIVLPILSVQMHFLLLNRSKKIGLVDNQKVL